MNNSYYGTSVDDPYSEMLYHSMLVRDPFSEIPKTPNKSLYFKDEAWMKYHKCPECGQYVVKPPSEIKYARGDSRNWRRFCWNSALRTLSKKTGLSPCYKCTAKYAKLLYYGWDFNNPVYTDCYGIPPRGRITATRTGQFVIKGE